MAQKDSFKTIIEPFKIKVVEPVKLNTEKDRNIYLQKAHYNPFMLQSEQVIIDLLTDSGTAAMSAEQWASIMRADESYAGAKSWERMRQAIHNLTGYEYILPTHQGRAAERILYGYLAKKKKVFISNTHFDTTRANIEFFGAEAVDLLVDDLCEDHDRSFQGNIDTKQLEKTILDRKPENIGAVILTVTNNSGGGQPVSMKNAQEVSRLCNEYDVLFIIDACRVAENAFFIKEREKGFEQKSYQDIAKQMFSLANGCIMSAKKDAIVNTGGFLALRSQEIADACTNMLIITEGFATYGGLAGRDMEAIAVGLDEGFQHEYLKYRIHSTAYLGEKLNELGVPVILPVGGHAVYIDARAYYPDIPIENYPGQALACQLYLKGGIRCCEIGSVMFGKYDKNGDLIPAKRDLVRLAIPRRVYTQSHIDYVIETFEHMQVDDKVIKGYDIIYEQEFLRHFTAKFRPAK